MSNPNCFLDSSILSIFITFSTPFLRYLDMNLTEYKSFIDEEMLKILKQLDAPTKIFDHVYLGSEWNASNLEELQKNGYVFMSINHIRLCNQLILFFSGFHSNLFFFNFALGSDIY